MARFSGPDVHASRRAEVDAAIDGLDPDQAEQLARELTLSFDRRGNATFDELARCVPTMTMVSLLGLAIDPVEVVDDVERVVLVIGRGEPADDAADAATDRLLAATGSSEPEAADAVVSLLYQNFDATAALLRTTVEAHTSGRPPEAPVRATRRVATAPNTIAGHELGVGDEVVLEIGAAGLPYGAGPHACPGRLVAEAIVRGMVVALEPEPPAAH